MNKNPLLDVETIGFEEVRNVEFLSTKVGSITYIGKRYNTDGSLRVIVANDNNDSLDQINITYNHELYDKLVKVETTKVFSPAKINEFTKTLKFGDIFEFYRFKYSEGDPECILVWVYPGEFIELGNPYDLSSIDGMTPQEICEYMKFGNMMWMCRQFKNSGWLRKIDPPFVECSFKEDLGYICLDESSIPYYSTVVEMNGHRLLLMKNKENTFRMYDTATTLDMYDRRYYGESPKYVNIG